MGRIRSWNGYETELAQDLLAGQTTMEVVNDASNLGVPSFLVINPDIPARREWVRVTNVSTTTLTIIRDQAGSTGGDVLNETHPAGDTVRATSVHQWLDEIFTDVEANTAAIAQNASDLNDHEIDATDPHAAAGYVKDTEADATYLRLDGGNDPVTGAITFAQLVTMQNGLSVSGAPIDANGLTIQQVGSPTLDDEAATKKYVDDFGTAPAVVVGSFNDTANTIAPTEPGYIVCIQALIPLPVGWNSALVMARGSGFYEVGSATKLTAQMQSTQGLGAEVSQPLNGKTNYIEANITTTITSALDLIMAVKQDFTGASAPDYGARGGSSLLDYVLVRLS